MYIITNIIKARQDSPLVEPRSLGGCSRGTQTLDITGCSDFLISKTFMLSIGWLWNSADTKVHFFTFVYFICQLELTKIPRNYTKFHVRYSTKFHGIPRKSIIIFTCGISIFHPKTGGGGLLYYIFPPPPLADKVPWNYTKFHVHYSTKFHRILWKSVIIFTCGIIIFRPKNWWRGFTLLQFSPTTMHMFHGGSSS